MHMMQRPCTSQRIGPRHPGSSCEVPLHGGDMRLCWRLLGHTYVRACMNEITKRLFTGEGIVVFQGNEPRAPSSAFRKVLNREYVPFVRDALDCIMAFGIVPIAFRSEVRAGGVGEDHQVPYVPRYGTYNVTTWSEAGVQRFRFYWAGNAVEGVGETGGTPDDRVLIAHDFGADPDLSGRLRSNLWTAAAQLGFIDELHGLALTGERIAANPPLVTAYNPAVETKVHAQFKDGFFVGDTECVDRAQAGYERSAEQHALFQANMQTWERHMGVDAATQFGAAATTLPSSVTEPRGHAVPKWARDWRGAEMPWSREYWLEPTRSLVSPQLPRTRPDLVPLTQHVQEVVCGVLNVPRGMLSTGSHIKSGVDAVQEAMARTVNRWADVLGGLMTGVYNHTFGVNDLREELRIRWHRRRRGPLDLAANLLTEADLFEADEKTRIRLAFDLPPTTTPERLDQLYNRGIIAWRAYATMQLRMNNLARDYLASEDDPFTHDEQRALVFGAGKRKRTDDDKSDGQADAVQQTHDDAADEAKKRK